MRRIAWIFPWLLLLGGCQSAMDVFGLFADGATAQKRQEAEYYRQIGKEP